MSDDAGEIVLSMTEVHKGFGDVEVVRGASLEVRRGETLAIIGASGCGKSVALRMLIGLLWPDEGSVAYEGRKLEEMESEELARMRRDVAYVFQEDALFDSMSVLENVTYALVEHTKQGDAEMIARAWECLELVGLGQKERPNILGQMPAELSGGMRRRVALARSIALVPKVILYDEPMGGLDPANCRRIADMIANLQAEYSLTSVVVTHHLPSVWRIADRVALMHEGRFLHVAPTEEFQALADPIVESFVSTEIKPPEEWV